MNNELLIKWFWWTIKKELERESQKVKSNANGTGNNWIKTRHIKMHVKIKRKIKNINVAYVHCRKDWVVSLTFQYLSSFLLYFRPQTLTKADEGISRNFTTTWTQTKGVNFSKYDFVILMTFQHSANIFEKRNWHLNHYACFFFFFFTQAAFRPVYSSVFSMWTMPF